MTDNLDPVDQSIQVPEPASQADQPWTKTTLGKQGPKLPIGIETGGQLVKDFETVKWTFKQDKALAKYREENKGATIGQYVSQMVGLLMTKVGPHDFTKLSDAEKQLVISQLYLGDVLYMYVYLRKVALGSMLPTTLQCPFCDLRNERHLDLDELDVRAIDDPAKLIQRVELTDGLTIFGDLREWVELRPPKWQVMSHSDMLEHPDEASRFAVLLKDALFRASGIDTTAPLVVLDEDMDELSKIDVATLEAAIENIPGPQMVIELTCSRPGCKRNSIQIVNWQFDSFFSISSRSQPGGS